VRVTQYYRINLLRIERKGTVALDGFFAMALEQTAFEQQPFAIDLEQIHRAGGRARRAEELDSHGADLTTDLSSVATLRRMDERGFFTSLNRKRTSLCKTIQRFNESHVARMPAGDARLVQMPMSFAPGQIHFFRCENTLDMPRRFVRLARLVMKYETTNTVLTFILGALVLLGVIFALKTINQTRELRLLASQAMAVNTGLMREQAFFNDCLEYSKTHSDINRILQPADTKSATHR
jgi:hypothetical protein